LMVVAMIAAAVGLGVVGIRWLAGRAAHGLKAGIFAAFVGILAIAWLTWWIGTMLEHSVFASESSELVGAAVTLAVGAGLLVLAGRWFFRPATEELLGEFEDQGWFTAAGYKKSQGRLVRRGTIVGIGALIACGLWTLTIGHHTLETGPKDWALLVPFSGGSQQFIVLADVRFTLPLLLAAAALWLTYRIVNFPAFADFLIATEAELNKVSWTTRKRLVQDTIVVLTTVVLLTVFLLLVDSLWGWLLSREYIGVLPPAQSQQQQEQKEQPW
jgi:preprotein translocase SecE subunit